MGEDNKNINFKNLFNIKNIKLLVIGFIALIVLLFLSAMPKESKKNSVVEKDKVWSWMSYCSEIENKLNNVLGQIKNIGNVESFIMVDSSPTIKYLEEVKQEDSNKDGIETKKFETSIVLSKNGSITTPVVVVEMLPKITGVLVVASGVGDTKTKNMLINTISAVLGVSVSNVEVLEGK